MMMITTQLINYGIKSIQLLMEEKTVTKLVRDIQSNFDINGDLAANSEVFAPFFADTLVKHYNLWRYVLVQDREVSVTSHEGIFLINSFNRTLKLIQNSLIILSEYNVTKQYNM